MLVTILSLLISLPKLIQAAEGLYAAFKSSGAQKKQSVLTAIGNAVDAANAAGSTINKDQVTQIAGVVIDDIVAVQNALGFFSHGGHVPDQG